MAELSPLKKALVAIDRLRAKVDRLEGARREPIAIVGIGCRLPGGVRGPDQFWRRLQEGFDGVVDVPAERWSVERLYDADPDRPGTTNARRAALIDGFDRFDPAFFGISPREARAMDPQQRLVLEVAWEALEHAGQRVDRLAGSKSGVWVGAVSTAVDYMMLHHVDLERIGPFSSSGSAHSILANRISYLLDLQGPSVTVDTACSSSLVAVHAACQALRAGECDLALAGGVHLVLSPESDVALTKLHMLAPDGRCKTFDARADGFVRGEGCGVVVLKRLSDATAAGDRIVALVRGNAVNQDGSTNGITAPNGLSQQRVIKEALASGAIAPEEVLYAETHGTGTELGDPIEVEALAEVLGRAGDRPLLLGALKSNIGHLEGAAGIAGLIKAALVLQHAEVPPNLHFERLNPHISLDGTRLRIADRAQPLPAADGPRCGTVSSFGFGGTNAHVILQRWETEAGEAQSCSRPAIVPISARDEEALTDLAESYLDRNDLLDVAYTAGTRRTPLEQRAFAVGGEFQKKSIQEATFGESKCAWVFSGQGSQWDGMGVALAKREPTFAAALEEIDALLDFSLMDELGGERLGETLIAQPAIFAIQVALARLWQSWGQEPDAVVGHSVGEVAAAHVAGALTLEGAVALIRQRAELMQQATGLGRMLAVGLDEAAAMEFVARDPERLALAAQNGPRTAVLAGDTELLTAIHDELKAARTFRKWLPVDYAFHSPQVEPFRKQLVERLSGLKPDNGAIAFWSTVRGEKIAHADLDANYWGRNVRDTVRFATAIESLFATGHRLFLEIGPSAALTGAIKQTVDGAAIVASMAANDEEALAPYRAVGQLWTFGREIDWEKLYPGRRPVDLPTYPWRHRSYWLEGLEPGQRPIAGASTANAHPLLGTRVRTPGSVHEARISTTRTHWLDQHRYFEIPLLPMTAYLEMALAASDGRAVGGMVLRHPLAVGEGQERFVQTVVDGDAASVHSSSDGESWQQHASWKFVDAQASDALSVESIRARCEETVDLESFYAEREAGGAAFGPAFRAIVSMRRRDGEALAELDPQPAAGVRADPALLDAAIHPLIAALDADAQGKAWVPFSLERFVLHASLERARWSHATVREAGEGRVAEVAILDADGAVLASFDGLLMQAADPVALRRAIAGGGEDLLRVVWRAVEIDAALDERPWIVREETGGFGEQLAGRLSDRGVEVDFARDAASIARLCADGAVVVDTTSLDFTGEIPPEHMTDICAKALELAHTLREAGSLELTTTIFVTRGATDAAGDVAHPEQAPLVGWARSVRREHPEWDLRLVDLDPGPTPDPCGELLAVVGGDEPEIALRAGEARVPRLVVHAPSTERALQLDPERRGLLESLDWKPVERREPGPGQIEIEVRATGLNFRDVLNAMDLYPGDPGPLGDECAGVVTRVGEGVELEPGTAVFGIAAGAFATHVVTDARLVVPKPTQLTFAEAASLPIVFLTALIGLEDLAKLQSGQRVLIHAAAGGVGMAAIQVAKRIGAKIVGTAGNPAKRALVERLGAAEVRDSRSVDFGEGLAPVDVVLNSLADDFIPKSFALLREGGAFVEIGKTGIWEPERVARERPDVDYHIFYLGDLFSSDPERVNRRLSSLVEQGLRPLPLRSFDADSAIAAYRTMQAAKHVGKIAVTREGSGPTGRVPDRGTVLVTGGLGGLGLATAEWLADRGARSLLLVGRSARENETIERLRDRGIEVRVEQADCSDRDAMQRLVESCELSGVVHAAGVLDDGLLADQTTERMAAVFAPKLLGARWLHELTLDRPLELFVMYAAGAALLGNPGQSAYTAANAYLDALASRRRALGLPALAVDWGAWEGIGMAADLDARRREQLAAGGFLPLSAERAFAALDALLAGSAPQVAVLPLDATRLSGSVSILGERVVERPQSAATTLDLTGLAPVKARQKLRTFVERSAAQVLGIDEGSAFDAQQPLNALGLDSLMAVELRNALAAAIDRPLATTLLFDHPTVGALVEHLGGLLELDSDTPKDERHAEVDALSDEEAEAALLAELSAEDEN